MNGRLSKLSYTLVSIAKGAMHSLASRQVWLLSCLALASASLCLIKAHLYAILGVMGLMLRMKGAYAFYRKHFHLFIAGALYKPAGLVITAQPCLVLFTDYFQSTEGTKMNVESPEGSHP